MIECAQCGHQNAKHYRFCLGCGAELPQQNKAEQSLDPIKKESNSSKKEGSLSRSTRRRVRGRGAFDKKPDRVPSPLTLMSKVNRISGAIPRLKTDGMQKIDDVDVLETEQQKHDDNDATSSEATKNNEATTSSKATTSNEAAVSNEPAKKNDQAVPRKKTTTHSKKNSLPALSSLSNKKKKRNSVQAINRKDLKLDNTTTQKTSSITKQTSSDTEQDHVKQAKTPSLKVNQAQSISESTSSSINHVQESSNQVSHKDVEVEQAKVDDQNIASHSAELNELNQAEARSHEVKEQAAETQTAANHNSDSITNQVKPYIQKAHKSRSQTDRDDTLGHHTDTSNHKINLALAEELASESNQVMASSVPPNENMIRASEQVVRVCSQCSAIVPKGFAFCGGCGTRYQEPQAQSYHAPPSLANTTQGDENYLRLIHIHPDGTEGEALTLNIQQLTVGRNSSWHIFQKDLYLSPKHATFIFKNNDLYIRDEGGLNGIFIKIKGTTELKHGDQFRVGQQLLCFERLRNLPGLQSPDGTRTLGSPFYEVWGRLCHIVGQGQIGQAWLLQEPQAELGRVHGQITFTKDRFMSGRHCLIHFMPNHVTLTDLESTNGTFIRIQGSVPLVQGDLVLLGQQIFRVDLGYI